jgi:hypothetical protein
MEAEAEPMQFADLQLVDHPRRPSVRRFFQDFAPSTAVIHGILTPSVAHVACLRLIKTGAISSKPDWASILSHELYTDAPLPHLAISGEVFPEQFSSLFARTGSGGQLEALLDGTLSTWSDIPMAQVDSRLLIAEQEMRQRRMGQLIESNNSDIFKQANVSRERAKILQERASRVQWGSDGSFLGDCLLAADILEQGISPCLSITHPSLWDSHSNNDVYQHWLWEDLFFTLSEFCTTLQERRGVGASLLDETTIVVCSDMGRSPNLNGDLGKDHWPYSSAMIIDSHIQGGRAFGGYDEYFAGMPMDLGTGDGFAGGEVFTASHFGATLLEIQGVDWREYLPNAMPISAILA